MRGLRNRSSRRAWLASGQSSTSRSANDRLSPDGFPSTLLVQKIAPPEVSIVIPARNEEMNLENCLQSLTSQRGVRFEIIVVDDASTDRTREIAQSFASVRVLSTWLYLYASKSLPDARWTGKNIALFVGARSASAPWILFTDADTIHLPGSLARALAEAKSEDADLLSYSPEQIVATFAERAVMPVVFAELAARYPPQKVRDPDSGIVAANGQYILVRRAAYEAVGGHAAVATEILEDVALARRFRDAGKKIFFRYGGDAVRTRMYRNWPQLREGWTKNLALLFPHPGLLAARTMIAWVASWSALVVAAVGLATHHRAWLLLAARWPLLYRRIHTAHFAVGNNVRAISAGMPLFAYLLLRSKRAHARGQVEWKGRSYQVEAKGTSKPPRTQPTTDMPPLAPSKLRTDN
jgi:glycosyltransferase involved in cell wall biosynthesis